MAKKYAKIDYREGIWNLISYGFKEDNLEWNTIKAKPSEKLLLILKHMSLSITQGNTLVENFSFFSNDIKRIVHLKDSMAFVIEQQAVKRRYFRLRFFGGPFFTGEQLCSQCALTLSNYVTPINQNQQTGQKTQLPLSHYIREYLKKSKEFPFSNSMQDLESIYPLEEVIEECILDVDFPDLAVKIHNIIKSTLEHK